MEDLIDGSWPIGRRTDGGFYPGDRERNVWQVANHTWDGSAGMTGKCAGARLIAVEFPLLSKRIWRGTRLTAMLVPEARSKN